MALKKMSYRPEGWKNPNPELTELCGGKDCAVSTNLPYHQYEAGADALLEGLRKEGCKGRIVKSLPQSKDDKKEQTRLRVQRYRERKSVTESPNNVTQSPNSVTESPDSVTQYPAIIHALTDPDKRIKLEKIYLSLKNFKQEGNIYYGYPDKGLSFDIVGELLEATK